MCLSPAWVSSLEYTRTAVLKNERNLLLTQMLICQDVCCNHEILHSYFFFSINLILKPKAQKESISASKRLYESRDNMRSLSLFVFTRWLCEEIKCFRIRWSVETEKGLTMLELVLHGLVGIGIQKLIKHPLLPLCAVNWSSLKFCSTGQVSCSCRDGYKTNCVTGIIISNCYKVCHVHA